jgi:PAS domain S-box-containing protein
VTSRRIAFVYLAAGVVLGAGALAVVLASDRAPGSELVLLAAALVGWAFFATAAVAQVRRPGNRTALLLALVGCTWFLGWLTYADSPFWHTLGMAMAPFFLAPFVHLLLAYPTGRLERRSERLLVVGVYGVVIVLPTLLLLFDRTPPMQCDGCPRNAFLVTSEPRAEDALTLLLDAAAILGVVAVTVVLARRWRSASITYRRALTSVLFSGGLALLLIAVGVVVRPLSSAFADAVAVGAAVAFTAVPLFFLAGLLRGPFALAAVARLIGDLGVAPAPGRLRDALRGVLRDPTLDLGYWVSDPPGYIDIEGRKFDPDESSAATFVEDESGRIAVLVHDPALLEDRDLLDGVAAAARLALANERLHAELRARVRDLEGERDFTRLVVDTAPAYFCVVDPQGRIARFNQTLSNATGIVDDDEVRGRLVWEVFGVPEEAEDLRASLAITAVGGRGEPHDQTLLARDGSRRVVTWSEVVIPDDEGQLRYVLLSGVDITERLRHEEEVRRVADEQAALRRVATLVASGPTEAEVLQAVTYEVGQLFGAQSANTLRWEGDSVLVVGGWSAPGERTNELGRVFPMGGDTVTGRVVQTGAPARIESRDDLKSEFALARWTALGLHATIGAPIVVDGRLWGVVSASRTHPNDPFPIGAEGRLGDFAALVAQAIANAEARREVAALAEEQAALRRAATLVAGGRSRSEVLEAVTREVGELFGATSVHLMRWAGIQDVFVVLGGWAADDDRDLAVGATYRACGENATVQVLETGHAAATLETAEVRAESGDWVGLGAQAAVAAPVIVGGNLWGAVTACRRDGAFPEGTEVRLRNFANLIAQSIANDEAREELQASRARIVKAADDARRRLERNLHDGAQQRLVAVSISLRLALAKLDTTPDESERLLAVAAEELTQAIEELRELARGIHPAILTDRGLAPALEALARRAPVRVDLRSELEGGRLPPPVEVAAYYVVSESLANVAKYAQATEVQVRVERRNGVARVEVADDGVGGADPSGGSGLRGLADRVEALDGRLGVESVPGAGTRVWAEIPAV